MQRALYPLLATLVVARPAVVSAQQLPAPTGPSAVGTISYEWVDTARAEVVEFFGRDSASRQLASMPARGGRSVVVQLWYPAANSSGTGPTAAPYNPDIEAFAPAMDDSARIRLYRTTSTHAGWGAPLAPGDKLPVLVFSPGGGTFRSDYTALYEDLASHGYVVAAVSHPGITLMSLADGRIAGEWSGWQLPPGLGMSLERDSLRASADFFARTRDTYSVGDVRFVLDRLGDLDRGADRGRFAGRLEPDRAGAFGHSTGGAVVVAAAHADRRIRAVLVYDVILPRVLFGEELAVPLMLFRTDDARYPPGWHDLQRETFEHLRARGYDAVLRGGGHNSFSDRALLSPSRYAYRLDANRAIQLIRLYTRAFFDAHVRERPSASLRPESSPPEITLTIHPGGSH